MSKKAVRNEKAIHVRIDKKTSQASKSSRVKFSSMNKHKKRGYKAYKGQGR